MIRLTTLLACILLLTAASLSSPAQQLYELPPDVETRWYSFENPDGTRGDGGRANDGRKGAAWKTIKPGETVVLADIAGPGVVRRIWLTVPGRVDTLRGWIVRFYWDDQRWPSVEAPLQDFFGLPFARQAPFESALFSNPEGRSFNTVVPMPFRKRARLTITNEAPAEANLFYDVNATLGDELPAEVAYFHARYRRENPTTPKQDFEVLPKIEGRGRYLGANVGVRSTTHALPFWFGEGELKIYLDDDRELPTLVGTGTEDLVGSAWGLGRFDHLFQGAPLTAEKDGVWGFYRYHIPDPIYFRTSIRVTLQQMAGGSVNQLRRLATGDRPELVRTHRPFDPVDYSGAESEGTWENFETPQDVCATAYWYQVLPSPRWPPLEPYASRVADLGDGER
jgi:D-arabinan exo alpha-(1,3)/(1,5)-arabinofuranosidase (non-reducing end)